MNAPRPRPPRRAQGGFTLIELLVAIGILAIVSVLSWRGLSTLIDTRARLEPEAARTSAWVAALGQMEIDLARAPRNASLFALPRVNVAVSVRDGRHLLQILRLVDAADGTGTDAVQTVQYEVVDGALVREHSAATPVASGPAPGLTEREVLLTGVDRLQLRVWSRASQAWLEPGAALETPPALEIRVVLPGGTEMRRVLEVG